MKSEETVLPPILIEQMTDQSWGSGLNREFVQMAWEQVRSYIECKVSHDSDDGSVDVSFPGIAYLLPGVPNPIAKFSARVHSNTGVELFFSMGDGARQGVQAINRGESALKHLVEFIGKLEGLNRQESVALAGEYSFTSENNDEGQNLFGIVFPTREGLEPVNIQLIPLSGGNLLHGRVIQSKDEESAMVSSDFAIKALVTDAFFRARQFSAEPAELTS